MKKTWIPLLLISLLLIFHTTVLAQTYLFELEQLTAEIFINQDGSASIDYKFSFRNDPSASPIEYVDVGMPNDQFSLSGAEADVNGQSVSISRSDYEGDGSGFAVVLGGASIAPGASGTVHTSIPDAGTWLRFDSQDTGYASIAFSPTWFGSKYVKGTTQMKVVFHLPPGILPEEPRWHEAPSGWPAQPETGLDADGRVVYTWTNEAASPSTKYEFGASFPTQYVPTTAVSKPSIFETLGISSDTCFTFLCCGGIFATIVGLGWWNSESARKRKLQYLPPKITIEGLGIKRGLTAVEAAILMEQSLDKVMTMVLFGVLKKNAATVRNRDPLELEVADPIPDGINPYETDFLKAFKIKEKVERRKALQSMTIDLVQAVSNKMKGFSRKETIAYYQDIIEKAWKQVETAQTPEVKSENFDKYLEWTMLDKEYDDRTRDVFRTGPVFIPTWWGRYDPTYSRPISTTGPLASPTQAGSPSGGGVSLPTLPGGSFAASIVTGVENFSAGVIGNVNDFTRSITNKTNPVPVPTVTRSTGTRSGGGGGCACACACAGCACACAGGGR